MADAAISLVVKKLGDALSEEVSLLGGVRDQVLWLRDELQWMKCFLKDAKAKSRKGNELVSNWVRMVRDVAYRAEDIIDIFTLKIDRRRRSGVMGRIERYASLASQLKAIHKVGVDIAGLRVQIDEIKASRERYGLVDLGDQTTGEASRFVVDEAVEARRRIYPHLADETLVVGLNSHKRMILEQLLDTNITRRVVISIVGVGGLGKTTLANKIYNSYEIKASFSTCACVSVSQDHKAGELLKNIAKQVMGTTATTEGVDIDDLRVRLYDFLKERSYFIVLDDVWSRDVWNQVVTALPDVNNGSRVLMTTRDTSVAKSADSSITPYQLPLLNDDESWELFLRKALPANQDVDINPSCPRHLEDIGRQLVGRCGGLPLALSVLGGLVSTKDPSPAEWMKMAERWASTPDGEVSLKILELSYDDLPHHHLRSCFRYLGSFPEDYLIDGTELTLLWIAEGFIPQETGAQLMEDTAQTYLHELVQRSMIQVVDEDEYRVHDLFHDLCVREAREDGALNVDSTYTNHDSISHDHTLRRLALHFTKYDNAEEYCCPSSNLRSLLIFGTEVDIEILNGLKLLRVVHIMGDNIDQIPSFPKEIASMVFLRYLKLGRVNPHITILPTFFGNLYNLQTLDITDSDIRQLPANVLGKMLALRHIYCCYCKFPPNIGNLTNLQTIERADAKGGWIEGGGLEKLFNIRDLAVIGLKATQVRVLLDSLKKQKRLSSLNLQWTELIPIELITDISNHNHLHRLRLDGPMSPPHFPTLRHGFPANLTMLTLISSGLEQLAMLEMLTNLMFLNLKWNSYKGKEMVCTSGGFTKLQMCYLEGLDELEDWRVEAGAMPNLTTLIISYCSSLTMLPEGLQHVTSLQELIVDCQPKQFQDRLRPEVGEDWYKIQHVRSVNTHFESFDSYI